MELIEIAGLRRTLCDGTITCSMLIVDISVRPPHPLSLLPPVPQWSLPLQSIPLPSLSLHPPPLQLPLDRLSLLHLLQPQLSTSTEPCPARKVRLFILHHNIRFKPLLEALFIVDPWMKHIRGSLPLISPLLCPVSAVLLKLVCIIGYV